MVLKKGLLMVAVMAGLLAAGPAMATIDVYVLPVAQTVPLGAGTTSVGIYADIPATDAIVGWGLDLTLGGDLNITNTGVTIDPAFDIVPSGDGDGLVGVVNFLNPPVEGMGVLLATVSFSLDALGTTTLTLSDDGATDVTEGFQRDDIPPDLAQVNYVGGSIEVVPEPASLALLALGSFALIRRR